MTQAMVWAAMSSLALLGCGASHDDGSEAEAEAEAEAERFDVDVDTTEQGILNGNPVDDEYGGVVGLLLNTTWGCSGVLISNTVVMTAKHCVEEYSNNQIVAVMGVQLQMAAGRRLHPTEDLALLWLKGPMTVYGPNWELVSSNYWRPIDLREYWVLVGQYFHVLGHGPWNAAPLAGTGTLRYATLMAAEPPGLVPELPRDHIRFFPNAAGQVAYFGDSGGPALRPMYAPLSQLPLTGIMTGLFWEPRYRTEYSTPNIWFGWLIESLLAGPA